MTYSYLFFTQVFDKKVFLEDELDITIQKEEENHALIFSFKVLNEWTIVYP